MTQLLVGLVLFGLSLAMLVAADLGLDPWDVFHQGVARQSGIRLGVVVVAASLAVLLLWIPLRERPGLGTVLNAVLVGVVFEATIPLFGDPSSTTWRWTLLVLAIAVNALGTGCTSARGSAPVPEMDS